MRSWYSRIIVCAALVVGISLLGATTGAARQEVAPGKTVRAFYMAIEEQSYDQAQAMTAAPLLAKIKQAGGFSKYAVTRTGPGVKIKGVQTLKENVAGQTASVSTRLHFTNGRTKDIVDALIKENGAWKLTTPATGTPAKSK